MGTLETDAEVAIIDVLLREIITAQKSGHKITFFCLLKTEECPDMGDYKGEPGDMHLRIILE